MRRMINMMIIDFSQIMLSTTYAALKGLDSQEEQVMRHMVLNMIRSIKTKYKDYSDEIILACDGKGSWRKDVFPQYKAHRKKERAAQQEKAEARKVSGKGKAEMDWKQTFEILDKLKTELKENFPYKLIEIEKCEGDDIIGTLCEAYAHEKKIMVVSSDKDFVQLQRYGVVQYDPIKTKKIVPKVDNPVNVLREHIIRGDRGDGIPNILSGDDTIINNERQAVLNETRMNYYMTNPLSEYSTEAARNFSRNMQLIDLAKIPETYKEKILTAYESYTPVSGVNYKYFFNNNLKHLMEKVSDFK